MTNSLRGSNQKYKSIGTRDLQRNPTALQVPQLNNILRYVSYKYIEKHMYSYNPCRNNKRLLLLLATHTDSKLKLKNIQNTINLFNYGCIDIVVCNSTHLPYNKYLNSYYKSKNIRYFEVPNDSKYDFGKWNYLLRQVDYPSYDYVIFMNDSIVMKSPVAHFINLAIKNNTDLYGYNDSTQSGYHYQSYLFCIKSGAINKFMYMFESQKSNVNSFDDVIHKYETKMTNFFPKHNCYLKIGNIPLHINQNIYHNNHFLYGLLSKTGVLPFIKIKQLI